MTELISPALINNHVTAFFTGKSPGAAPAEISRIVHVSADKIYLPIQKHTDKIVVIESSLAPVIADAVITKVPGILIGVRVADCVPILLYETTQGIMGAVHAGWRGTAESILMKTIKMMINRFVCSEENIHVAVGPAIRWCCYPVGFDVIHAVSRATGSGNYAIQRGDKHCLDLPTANKYQALSAGIPQENIWFSGECTFCNPDRYYSYRFSRGTTGRQGAFIGRI
jgi:YfiH family protein